MSPRANENVFSRIDNTLVVVLGSELSLSFESGTGGIQLSGDTYSIAIERETNGFYDWIRTSERRVVGVRLWPFEESKFILKEISALKYVEVTDEMFIVHFTGERVFDEKISQDQSFVLSQILFSATRQEYALRLDASRLTPGDLVSLRHLPVAWRTAVESGGWPEA